MSGWVNALENYISTKGAEIIPDGWFTRNEIAKLFGRTPSTTSRILADMVREGGCQGYHFPTGHLLVASLALNLTTHPHFLQIRFVKCSQVWQVANLD